MKARLVALVFAGTVGLVSLSKAEAQLGIQIGNPYSGGITIGSGLYGSPYGYGYGAPVTSYYSSGYVAPGFVAPAYVAPVPIYGNYGYRSYGYGYRNYGYGNRGYGGYGRGYGGWGRGGRWR